MNSNKKLRPLGKEELEHLFSTQKHSLGSNDLGDLASMAVASDRNKGAVKKIAPTATKKFFFVAVGEFFFTAPFRN